MDSVQSLIARIRAMPARTVRSLPGDVEVLVRADVLALLADPSAFVEGDDRPIRLTDITVSQIMPRENEFLIWDRDLKCFGLRISPTGVKAFIVQARPPTGGTKRVTLGRVDQMTADAARLQAKWALGEIKAGRDPAMARREARLAARKSKPTVADAWQRFNRERMPSLAPQTQDHYEYWFQRVLAPELGQMHVDRVSPARIRELIAAVARERGVRSSGYVRSTLSVLMRFAVSRGWAEINPCLSIEPAVGDGGRSHEDQECLRSRSI
jgi:hypothetical protein